MSSFCQTLLAACCCGCMLASPVNAAENDWLRNSFEPEAGEQYVVPRPVPEVSIEDLSHLEGPFDSQFPDLSVDENPFYHGVETDRASFTPALSTATVGNVILESGYSFIANRNLPSQHSMPELVIRYGLTERIEARFGWNQEIGGGGSVISPVQQQEGLVAPNRETIVSASRFMGGLKVRLFDQDGLFPANTVLFEGYFPSFGDTRKRQVAATYAIGWELSPRWKLNASVRYATESEFGDDWSTWSPAIVLKVPFAERWTAQVEGFGVLPHGQSGGVPQYFAGPGLQVLLTPAIELNLRVGTGLNSVSPEFYSSAGFGVTF
ncbi:MAG TPA: transporter [Planctomycetaceae bacterium]|jgi:hypothetical protein